MTDHNNEYIENQIGGTFPGLSGKLSREPVSAEFNTSSLPSITDNTTEEAREYLIELFTTSIAQKNARIIIDGTFLFFLFASCVDTHVGTFEDAVEFVVDSFEDLSDQIERSELDVYIVLDGPESEDSIIKSRVLKSSRELESLLGPVGMDRYATPPVARGAIKKFLAKFAADRNRYPQIIQADKEGDAAVFEVGHERYAQDQKQYICMTVDGDVPIIATMLAHMNDRHTMENPFVVLVKPVVDQLAQGFSVLDVNRMAKRFKRLQIANLLFHNATDAGYGQDAKRTRDLSRMTPDWLVPNESMMDAIKEVVATFSLIKVAYEVNLSDYFGDLMNTDLLNHIDAKVDSVHMLCTNNRYHPGAMNTVLNMVFDTSGTHNEEFIKMIDQAHNDLSRLESKMTTVYEQTQALGVYPVFFIHPNILYWDVIITPYDPS
jgi:hypothetical protein